MNSHNSMTSINKTYCTETCATAHLNIYLISSWSKYKYDSYVTAHFNIAGKLIVSNARHVHQITVQIECIKCYS
jgi:hypothetical protein